MSELVPGAQRTAFTLPLFDAGKRRANLAAQDAQYDEAVEQYNQTVTDALREVVDALTSMGSLGRERAEQREALADAQEAYDLSVLRFREGVGNYLQVLTTEAQWLSQQSLDAELHLRIIRRCNLRGHSDRMNKNPNP